MIIKSIYTRRLKAKSRTKEECKAIIAIVLLPTLVNKDVYIKFAKELTLAPILLTKNVAKYSPENYGVWMSIII